MSAVFPKAMMAAMADELVCASGLLTELTTDLFSDPEAVRRHMVALQKLDLVTQIQCGIVDLLRSDQSVEEALDALPLEDMAFRLRAATQNAAAAGTPELGRAS